MRRTCWRRSRVPRGGLGADPVEKGIAETYLGEEVNDTLVMVPAHFNDSSVRPDLRHGRRYLRRVLLTIEDGVFEVKATAGDSTLERRL